MTTNLNSPKIRVGVLLQNVIQFLDIAAVDLLGALETEYLRTAGLSEDRIQKIGINFEFLYIGERNENEGLLTSSAKMAITVSWMYRERMIMIY